MFQSSKKYQVATCFWIKYCLTSIQHSMSTENMKRKEEKKGTRKGREAWGRWRKQQFLCSACLFSKIQPLHVLQSINCQQSSSAAGQTAAQFNKIIQRCFTERDLNFQIHNQILPFMQIMQHDFFFPCFIPGQEIFIKGNNLTVGLMKSHYLSQISLEVKHLSDWFPIFNLP